MQRYCRYLPHYFQCFPIDLNITRTLQAHRDAVQTATRATARTDKYILDLDEVLARGLSKSPSPY